MSSAPILAELELKARMGHSSAKPLVIAAATELEDLGQPEPPQWFSTSEEFIDKLDIPADAQDAVGPARKVAGGGVGGGGRRL